MSSELNSIQHRWTSSTYYDLFNDPSKQTLRNNLSKATIFSIIALSLCDTFLTITIISLLLLNGNIVCVCILLTFLVCSHYFITAYYLQRYYYNSEPPARLIWKFIISGIILPYIFFYKQAIRDEQNPSIHSCVTAINESVNENNFTWIINIVEKTDIVLYQNRVGSLFTIVGLSIITIISILNDEFLVISNEFKYTNELNWIILAQLVLKVVCIMETKFLRALNFFFMYDIYSQTITSVIKSVDTLRQLTTNLIIVYFIIIGIFEHFLSDRFIDNNNMFELLLFNGGKYGWYWNYYRKYLLYIFLILGFVVSFLKYLDEIIGGRVGLKETLDDIISHSTDNNKILKLCKVLEYVFFIPLLMIYGSIKTQFWFIRKYDVDVIQFYRHICVPYKWIQRTMPYYMFEDTNYISYYSLMNKIWYYLVHDVKCIPAWTQEQEDIFNQQIGCINYEILSFAIENGYQKTNSHRGGGGSSHRSTGADKSYEEHTIPVLERLKDSQQRCLMKDAIQVIPYTFGKNKNKNKNKKKNKKIQNDLENETTNVVLASNEVLASNDSGDDIVDDGDDNVLSSINDNNNNTGAENGDERQLGYVLNLDFEDENKDKNKNKNKNDKKENREKIDNTGGSYSIDGNKIDIDCINRNRKQRGTRSFRYDKKIIVEKENLNEKIKRWTRYAMSESLAQTSDLVSCCEFLKCYENKTLTIREKIFIYTFMTCFWLSRGFLLIFPLLCLFLINFDHLFNIGVMIKENSNDNNNSLWVFELFIVILLFLNVFWYILVFYLSVEYLVPLYYKRAHVLPRDTFKINNISAITILDVFAGQRKYFADCVFKKIVLHYESLRLRPEKVEVVIYYFGDDIGGLIMKFVPMVDLMPCEKDNGDVIETGGVIIDENNNSIHTSLAENNRVDQPLIL